MAKGALARSALKKAMGKAVPKNGDVKDGEVSPALAAAIEETWDAVDSKDKKAFSTALRAVMSISKNLE